MNEKLRIAGLYALTPTLKITLVLSHPAVAKNFPSGENCMCLTKAEWGDISYLTTRSASFEVMKLSFDRADTGKSTVFLRSGTFLPGPDDVVRLRKGFASSSPYTKEDWGLSRTVSAKAAIGGERGATDFSPGIVFWSFMPLIIAFKRRLPVSTGGGVETSVSDV